MSRAFHLRAKKWTKILWMIEKHGFFMRGKNIRCGKKIHSVNRPEGKRKKKQFVENWFVKGLIVRKGTE